jgi:hypothetical protein
LDGEIEFKEFSRAAHVKLTNASTRADFMNLISASFALFARDTALSPLSFVPEISWLAVSGVFKAG